MKSRASWKGHPIHPMLIVFPLGLWIGSFVADVLYLIHEDPFWYRAAWYAMLGGLLGGAAAAVPGILDYFGSVNPRSEAKPLARLHAILNLSAIALYALNLWWRSGDSAASGAGWWAAFALSGVCVVGLGVSGWLGGQLVYGSQIGIRSVQVNWQRTIYGPSLSGEAGEYVEVARADELGIGQMKHVVLNGTWIAIARAEDGYFAIDETCTHRGAPLCDGVLVGHMVQCPWHGSRFDVRTGEVLAGPADRPIPTFPLRVEKSSIQVQAPAGKAAATADEETS